MKMLVTGATGFVGQELVKISQNLRCVVRHGETNMFVDSFAVTSIDGGTNWGSCFEDVTSIIHLAGIAHKKTTPSHEYNAINTEGTLHLAEQAVKAGVKRFVFVSSIGVNGSSSNELPFTKDSQARPHNAYTQSKYEAELGLKKISTETGLEVVIIRPTLVYGASAPGNFGMLTKLVEKLPVLPFGFASNRRNFIAVQNLVDLLITCATHPDAVGHTFLASDSETLSTREFTNAIAEGLGKRVLQFPVPVSLMRFAGKLTGKSSMIEQLFGNLEVDSSNIKEVLNWTAPLTMKQAMKTLRETGIK